MPFALPVRAAVNCIAQVDFAVLAPGMRVGCIRSAATLASCGSRHVEALMNGRVSRLRRSLAAVNPSAHVSLAMLSAEWQVAAA